MKAVPGIYENGRIDFPFTFPDYFGPICVLVVFPGPCDETMSQNGFICEEYEDDDVYDDIPF